MGGSSLAPEVMRAIIGRTDGYPALHVVDSTDPAQIRSVERAIDFRRTMFLVASKSGTTLEVNILKQHFFHRAVQAARRGRGRASLRVDDRSRLEARGDCEEGRLPRDLSRECRRSAAGIRRCRTSASCRPRCWAPIPCCCSIVRGAWPNAARRPAPDNSGLELGVVLGELALAGRDKPTLIAPPGLASFGAWLEQLVAESLGKVGKGIIPIEGEARGRARCLRARSCLHPRAICRRAGCGRRHGGRAARAGGPSGRAHRVGRSVLRSARNSIDGSSRPPSPARCSG